MCSGNSATPIPSSAMLRFNTPAELDQFVSLMADAGVDAFHCSTRRFWDTEFNSDQNLAAWTKKLSGKPTMTVGSIGMTGEHIDTLMGEGSNVASLDHLLHLVDRGDFDLIAVGRGMLVNPDWANKVREGRIDQLNDWHPDVLKGLI
jgi:2,4-dienoyl-CoA reductase-like NADH-dependent reductase (Old Yellow Enzyme family)